MLVCAFVMIFSSACPLTSQTNNQTSWLLWPGWLHVVLVLHIPSHQHLHLQSVFATAKSINHFQIPTISIHSFKPQHCIPIRAPSKTTRTMSTTTSYYSYCIGILIRQIMHNVPSQLMISFCDWSPTTTTKKHDFVVFAFSCSCCCGGSKNHQLVDWHWIKMTNSSCCFVMTIIFVFDCG